MPYTPNNIYYPEDSGPFQPAADMAQMASSIDLRIAEQNEIRSVANIAGRTALVNEVGLPNITTNQPLLVWRADAPNGHNLEVTVDGSTWRTYGPVMPYSSGTFEPVWAAGVTPPSDGLGSYVLHNGLVQLSINSFSVTVNIGPSGDTTNTLVCTLPEWLRPINKVGGTSADTGRVANYIIQPSGQVLLCSVAPPSTLTSSTSTAVNSGVYSTYILG